MGGKHTKSTDRGTNLEKDAINSSPPEVSFDDFEVLRAIGRGAFGKVNVCYITILDCLNLRLHYLLCYH